jgi:hypothetical protein
MLVALAADATEQFAVLLMFDAYPVTVRPPVESCWNNTLTTPPTGGGLNVNVVTF